MAGFAVGAVERDAVITGASIVDDDIVLGLASDGVHSNGFSLIRRIVEDGSLAYSDPAPFDPTERLGDSLLRPTRIYVRACLAAARAGAVKGLAHITGGGLVDNIPRVLPAGLAAEIDCGTWALPAVFRWLAETGGVDLAEMARTFNCGIGMVAVVAPDRVEDATAAFTEAGETVFRIGRICRRTDGPGVVLGGLEEAWRD